MIGSETIDYLNYRCPNFTRSTAHLNKARTQHRWWIQGHGNDCYNDNNNNNNNNNNSASCDIRPSGQIGDRMGIILVDLPQVKGRTT